jgi:hypothetical protein
VDHGRRHDRADARDVRRSQVNTEASLRAYRIVCFIAGASFLGFHFLPTWLMEPLFVLTPAAGPLLLAVAGALAMGRARRASETITAARLVAATIVSGALVLLPVAVFDFLFFGTVPYVGPLILIVAVPLHAACVGVFGAGLYALAEAEGAARARPMAFAAVAGFLSGIALAAIRVEIVPRSHGVFLRSFSASGDALPASRSPLARYGQQDIAETLGAKPREHHEPIAAIGDGELWIVRRGADCPGGWIERRSSDRGVLSAVCGGAMYTPTAIALDRTGGALVIGFDARSGDESWALQRFDANGGPGWRWSGNATARVDRAYAVWPAADGSVYVGGESGDIALPGTAGWVRKFDGKGHEIVDWNKRFPNAGDRRPSMAAVGLAGDGAGDVYVLLDLFNTPSVHKFDADGRELWQRDLLGHKNVAIAADDAGDLVITGEAGYPPQAWIMRVNADGTDAWEKTYPSAHLGAALAVEIDGENVYVAGFGTQPADKSSYWWIRSLTLDGVERWQRTLSGPDYGNVPFQIHVTAANEICVLGKGAGWQFSGSSLERFWGW